MTRPTLVCLALATVAVTACSRFDVQAVQDPGVRFAERQSFAWMPLDLAAPVDQRLQDRAIERIVHDGIDRGMAAKGYTQAPVDAADLLVTYRLTRDARQVAGAPRGYSAAGFGTWMGPGYSSETYERGSLVVDLFDTKARRLVWRGSASARLLPHKSFDWKAERATKAIDAIMRDAPSRGGRSD